jgi:hypothetical protein
MCGDAPLTIQPAHPTSTEPIRFSMSYPDPGWNFDGASVSVSGNEIQIVYLQTGWMIGALPACNTFEITLDPLLPDDYEVRVYQQHRDDPLYGYSAPVQAAPPLTLSVVPGSIQPVSVIEFYDPALNHYFVTADPAEAQSLLDGRQPGWVATGQHFGALPVNAPDYRQTAKACRFYGSVTPGPNSHFYTISFDECMSLQALAQLTPQNLPRWNYEGLAFASTLPVNGLCPSWAVPVYRAYNNGFARGIDSNHRITTSPDALQQVISQGWKYEGIVMCAPAP